MEFSDLQLDKPMTTQKINQFKRKGIYTVDDLVFTFPKKYVDYSHVITLNEAVSGEKAAMKVIVKDVVRRMGQKAGYVDAICREYETRNPITVRWFNPYIYSSIEPFIEKEVAVCGIFRDDGWGPQIINPDIFSIDLDRSFGVFPVYRKIQGVSDEYFQRVLQASIEQFVPEETIEEKARETFGVIPIDELINNLHNPHNQEDVKKASKRLVFERLYRFADRMVKDANAVEKKTNIKPMILSKTNEFIQAFPYELTGDQKAVVGKLVKSAQEGKRINALIQGDVGSGKTICAFLTMAAFADNGYQSALMAPTGVLAKQHYEELCSYIAPLGFTAVYLDGGLKAKEKREILEKIKDGTADFVIGTHSVISDNVEFKNLGLTVVDEEHKFGVIQRENLKKKADEGVHSISMSATPIPRSLALTLYGDALDIYTIHQMPNGRKPVKTAVVNNEISAFRFMEQEIGKGHQCYVVCPLIDGEDMVDSDDKEAPESVESVSKKIDNFFSPKGIKAEVVTGKMTNDEKTAIIDRFKNNETQILIATTIIEVGVNVPNATVITIMNAERYGLAGLHQLRGRVGRSSLQSYCILKSSEQNNPRLTAMVDTTDGFKIAEADLKLRGTGDFLGTKQSGDDGNIKLMMKYPDYYNKIKAYIKAKISKEERGEHGV